MVNCYNKNQSLKQYCDDTYTFGYKNWTKQELLKCYQLHQKEEASNIGEGHINGLQKEIECEKKETAMEKYKCLDIPTYKIDFCYD